MSKRRYISIFIELTKLRITVFVMLTTTFGFFCAANKLTIEGLWVSIGILLLACGSSIINHLQEVTTDSLMDRTKHRPLPGGNISKRSAGIWAIGLSSVGFLILFFLSGIIPAFIGLVTLVWYNVVYTPLKRKSILAIIPGSLIGALPPVAGWTAAGGAITNPQLLLIAFFFFIWQIPHFWLLLLVYHNDYEKAGFPTLFRKFNEHQIARITYFWLVATGLTGLLFPIFSIVKVSFATVAILLSVVWLLTKSIGLLNERSDNVVFKNIFLKINFFVVLLVIFIVIDKIITIVN